MSRKHGETYLRLIIEVLGYVLLALGVAIMDAISSLFRRKDSDT